MREKMHEAQPHLVRALNSALAQYTETMGKAFPVVPILEVTDDPEFWAIAEMHGDAFHIRVSSGTFGSTAALWASAFADEDFSGNFGQAVGSDAEAMTHISLVWLMLHEMHHFQMGHFDHPTETQAPKADDLEEFGLVTRTTKRDTTRLEASLIHEMQADHDATEMLLDAYSTEEWLSLRARAAAISAVVMLIERADSSNQSFGVTHPKAATRIFQLLGHVIEMPMLSAHPELTPTVKAEPRPSEMVEEETRRFTNQIAVPVFFDAVSLAKVASAQSIIGDLGSATDFFSDVEAVKLEHSAAPNDLITVGAQQWAKLIAEGWAKLS